jgi:hypothetical protein
MFITMLTNRSIQEIVASNFTLFKHFNFVLRQLNLWRTRRLLTTLVEFVSSRDSFWLLSLPNFSTSAIVCALLSSAFSTIGDKRIGQISQSNLHEGLCRSFYALAQFLGRPTALDWCLPWLCLLCPHRLPLPISVMCRRSPLLLLLWWFRCWRLWIAYFLHVFNPPAIQTKSLYFLFTTSPHQSLTLERKWAPCILLNI